MLSGKSVLRAQQVSLDPPSVTVAATKTVNGITFGTTAYARVWVQADGEMASYGGSSSTASPTDYETWLDSGLNTQVWVEMSIVTGSINHVNAGTTRLACTSNRGWGIFSDTTKTTTIDLDFYDAASGGTLLDSQRVTLDVESI